MDTTAVKTSYNLSFVICTKNRLPFLKILFTQFLNYCQADEEIVVIDGNSSDGSKEFLQQLFKQGKIHQFISEPDRNQAHGWNKGLLMARGIIIKKIIDDDVHSFPAIRRCKDFMLKNPEVDICISNCLVTDLVSPSKIYTASRLSYYEAWKNEKTSCFSFSDVYMLIRKSSLSFLGLFDTQFSMMDWEYSLRCSFLKANIIYYTGYNSMAVNTPGNVTSSANTQTLKKEAQIGGLKYNYKGDRSDISIYSEIKIAIGKAINYKKAISPVNNNDQSNLSLDITVVYNRLYKTLEEYNQAADFNFISK